MRGGALASALGWWLVAACGGGGGGDSPTEPTASTRVPSKVELSPPSDVALVAGMTLQLSVDVRDDAGRYVSTTVTYHSSAPNIATVSSTGVVSPVGPAGTANITASAGSAVSNAVRVSVVQGLVIRKFTESVDLETESVTSANVGVGDMDGDGDLDIVLAKGRHLPIANKVLVNDGRGRFAESLFGTEADRSYSAALADVEGDGDLDVIVSNDRPDAKSVYRNDGKAKLTYAGGWGEGEWNTRTSAAADLNGDSRPDIIAAVRVGQSWACLNDGIGNFPRNKCVPIPSSSSVTIVPADFNGDGFIDLAVPERDGLRSNLVFNDGKLGFTAKPFGNEATNARAAAAGDFNGDGRPDLVVADEKRGVFVYFNRGGGEFDPGFTLGATTLSPYSIAVADMNGDDKPDVVVGNFASSGSVFFNAGDGKTFVEVRFGDGAGQTYGLALGDLDGDGYRDIAAARSSARNIAYFSRTN